MEEQKKDGLWKYFVLPILILAVGVDILSMFAVIKNTMMEERLSPTVIIIMATLGVLFIVLVPSHIIARVSKQKKSKIIVIASGVVIGFNIMGLGASVFEPQEDKIRNKLAQEKIIEMMGDVIIGEDVFEEDFAVEDYGDMAVHLEFLQESSLDLQELEPKRYIFAENVDLNTYEYFSYDIIGSYKTISDYRNAIRDYLMEAKENNERIRTFMETFNDSAKELDLGDPMNKGVMKAAIINVKNRSETVNSNQERLNKLFLHLDNLLAFLEERQGEYVIEEEEIKFEEVVYLTRFNVLVEKYNDAIDEFGYYEYLY